MNAIDEPSSYADLVTQDNDEMKKAIQLVLARRKAYQEKSAKIARKELEIQSRSIEQAVTASTKHGESATLKGKENIEQATTRKNIDDFMITWPDAPNIEMAMAMQNPIFVGLVVVSTVFKHLPPLNDSQRVAATALHQVLCDVNLAGYLNQHCKLLVNPSRVEFLTELTTYEDIPPQSVFFFVFVSHGVRVTKGQHAGSFLMFPESRVSSMEELLLTGLHEKELANAFHRIPAANMLISFDICHTQNAIPDGQAPSTMKGRIQEDFCRKLLDSMRQLEGQRALDQHKRAGGSVPPPTLERGGINVPVMILESCKPRTQTSMQHSESNSHALFLRRLGDAFRGAAASSGKNDMFKNWTEDDTKFPFLYARDICSFVSSRVQFDAYEAASLANEKVTAKDILSIQYDDTTKSAGLEQTPRHYCDIVGLDFQIGKIPNEPKEAPCIPKLKLATTTSLHVQWEMPLVNSINTPILGFQLEIRGAGRACESWRLVSTKQVITYEDVMYKKRMPLCTLAAVGLSTDSAFCFRARARNAGGWGPFSASSEPYRTLSVTTSFSFGTDVAAKKSPQEVVAWMRKYYDDGCVQYAGCDALAKFVLTNRFSSRSSEALAVMTCGGIEMALAAMKKFTEDVNVQTAAANVIGTLVQHESVKAVLPQPHKNSAKILLNDLMGKFPIAQFGNAYCVAETALRMLVQPSVKRKMGLNEAAMKIQGLYRTREARRRLRDLARSIFPAVVDQTTGLVYYVNSRTGTTTWTPPSMFI